MRALTIVDVLKELTKVTNKYGMYISIYAPEESDWPEVVKAAPYLTFEENGQLLIDGYGILLFDTEDEMRAVYDLTVGDDGPTETNPYNGSIRVYALTCSNEGELWSENT